MARRSFARPQGIVRPARHRALLAGPSRHDRERRGTCSDRARPAGRTFLVLKSRTEKVAVSRLRAPLQADVGARNARVESGGMPHDHAPHAHEGARPRAGPAGRPADVARVASLRDRARAHGRVRAGRGGRWPPGRVRSRSSPTPPACSPTPARSRWRCSRTPTRGASRRRARPTARAGRSARRLRQRARDAPRSWSPSWSRRSAGCSRPRRSTARTVLAIALAGLAVNLYVAWRLSASGGFVKRARRAAAREWGTSWARSPRSSPAR